MRQVPRLRRAITIKIGVAIGALLVGVVLGAVVATNSNSHRVWATASPAISHVPAPTTTTTTTTTP